MTSVDGRAILFGGYGVDDVPLDDTWEWRDGAWAKVAGTAPSPRYYHALALSSGVPFLFGGSVEPGRDLDGTWTWKGGKWNVAPSSDAPRSRYAHALAARGTTVVLFGGLAAEALEDTVLGDTWEWNGSDWSERKVGGPSKPVGEGKPGPLFRRAWEAYQEFKRRVMRKETVSA
jgi:hypothetical protein